MVHVATRLPQEAETALSELVMMAREQLSHHCGKGKFTKIEATIFNNDGVYDVEVGGRQRKRIPRPASN